MALVQKQDSNFTGLSYAVEESLGVLPAVPVWVPLEPNSYDDFGGELETVARNPINPSRQRKKGVVVDLNASGGFEQDLTQENMQAPLESFMFAKMRRKGFALVTSLVAGVFNVTPGAGSDYRVGDILFAKDFAKTTTNRTHMVTASTANSVTVPGGSGLADTTGRISRVGFQFSPDDAEIDTSGLWPALVSSSKDMTQFGVIPGEWIFIGGDISDEQFATANNNGYACVLTVSANRIEFYKTQFPMSTDDGADKALRVYFGSVLKNEVGTNIVRTTLQLERTLGAPDTAQPLQVQSEYLVGCVANELEMQINTADKITANLGFIAIDNEQRTGAEGIKGGTRAVIRESDAFNTSTDVTRINLSAYSVGNASPLPLFAHAQELSISINNNATPNKAIGKLGSFEVTAGTFEVSASLDVYFANIEAVKLVRENADTTIDFHLSRANSGISVDMPMITLGDGRLNVEQDEAITLPLTADAATGAKFHPNLDHTLLFVFFDFLPSLAAA